MLKDAAWQETRDQLKAFLRGHFIEDATKKGIGPGRISVLRSFGIETALDVTPDRVSAVDGFGPARTSAIVGWRQSVEARFRFDPNKAVDPAERTEVEILIPTRLRPTWTIPPAGRPPSR